MGTVVGAGFCRQAASGVKTPRARFSVPVRQCRVTAGRDITVAITASAANGPNDALGNPTLAIGGVSAGRAIAGNITATNGAIGGVAAGVVASYTNVGWPDRWSVAGSIGAITISGKTGVGSVTANGITGIVSGSTNAGAIDGTTITSSNGSIGDIIATTGINATVTAYGSIGDVTTESGDIAGSLHATNGNLGDMTANAGSISATLNAGANIGAITAETDITGSIEATGDIASGGGQLIMATEGVITGDITSYGGSIGTIWAGTSLSGQIIAYQNIGDVTAGDFRTGDLDGAVMATFGSIGDILAWGKITGAVTAGTLIGTIWAADDITGGISAASGDLSVSSSGNVTGPIHAIGNAEVSAFGNISGNVTSSQGGITADAWGDISPQLTAAQDVVVWAEGNITGALNSNQGSITADAWGDMDGGSLHASGNVTAWAAHEITSAITSASGVVSKSVWAVVAATETGDIVKAAKAATQVAPPATTQPANPTKRPTAPVIPPVDRSGEAPVIRTFNIATRDQVENFSGRLTSDALLKFALGWAGYADQIDWDLGSTDGYVPNQIDQLRKIGFTGPLDAAHLRIVKINDPQVPGAEYITNGHTSTYMIPLSIGRVGGGSMIVSYGYFNNQKAIGQYVNLQWEQFNASVAAANVVAQAGAVVGKTMNAGGPITPRARYTAPAPEMPAKPVTGEAVTQILSKADRLAKVFEQVSEAPAATTADEAMSQMNTALDEVEDAYSGVPKDLNPPRTATPRMYAPKAESIVRNADGSITATSFKHVTRYGIDGSITVTEKGTGAIVFQKAGGI
jgi:hypothetical protein